MNSILKFGLEFLNKKLVVIFDKFKVSNPKIAIFIFAIIAVIVKGADVILNMPEVTLLLGGWLGTIKTIVYGLGLLFTALTAPHTAEAVKELNKQESLPTPEPTPEPVVEYIPEDGSINDVLNNSLVGTSNTFEVTVAPVKEEVKNQKKIYYPSNKNGKSTKK